MFFNSWKLPYFQCFHFWNGYNLQLLEGKDGRAPAKSVLCLQSPLRFYPACLSDLEMQREQTYYKRSWCFSAHHHHRVAKVGKLVWDLHVARKRAVTVATCLTGLVELWKTLSFTCRCLVLSPVAFEFTEICSREIFPAIDIFSICGVHSHAPSLWYHPGIVVHGTLCIVGCCKVS